MCLMLQVECDGKTHQNKSNKITSKSLPTTRIILNTCLFNKKTTTCYCCSFLYFILFVGTECNSALSVVGISEPSGLFKPCKLQGFLFFILYPLMYFYIKRKSVVNCWHNIILKLIFYNSSNCVFTFLR